MIGRTVTAICTLTLCAAGAAAGNLSGGGGGGGPIAFSSDTGAGTVNPFAWDGGDAGGFGTPGTLLAAMTYAASESGNFSGTGFGSTEVNVFLVDFSVDPNGPYGDAGLTAFVMWGNGTSVGSFLAEVDVSPLIDIGTDGSYNAGTTEIFALGPGVTLDGGNLTVDVDVNSGETPVGYAVTNLFDIPTGRLNEQWTLTGAIRTLGLYGQGEGRVWEGVDDNSNGDIFTDGMVLIVPSPASGALVLTALGGAIAVPRRRRTN